MITQKDIDDMKDLDEAFEQLEKAAKLRDQAFTSYQHSITLAPSEVLNKRIILNALRVQLDFYEQDLKSIKFGLAHTWKELDDPDNYVKQMAFKQFNMLKTEKRNLQRKLKKLRHQIYLFKRQPHWVAI